MQILYLLLLSCTLAYVNIPRKVTIEASSYYDAGYQFGQLTSDFVHARYKDDKTLQEKLIPFYNTDYGKEVFNHLYKVNNDRFPEYMEELRGQADGAKVPFEHAFMTTLNEEFSDYVPEEFQYEPVESCSDIILNEGEELGICHNEDGSLIDFNRTSFLHQTITINGQVVSSFYSWCYSGQLPTAAFGFNKDIAMTMNYLHTKKGGTISSLNHYSIDYNGIARNFIARYLLDATSMEDAWNRITNTPHAVGHNYQVMDLHKGTVVDIEMAPFARLGRFTALPEHPHFHSNMYSLIIVDDTPKPSSIHREARYKQFNRPQSFKDAMIILSDEKDQEEPIYRPTTLNSALFDFYHRKCYIYEGKPSDNKVLIEIDIFLVCFLCIFKSCSFFISFEEQMNDISTILQKIQDPQLSPEEYLNCFNNIIYLKKQGNINCSSYELYNKIFFWLQIHTTNNCANTIHECRYLAFLLVDNLLIDIKRNGNFDSLSLFHFCIVTMVGERENTLRILFDIIEKIFSVCAPRCEGKEFSMFWNDANPKFEQFPQTCSLYLNELNSIKDRIASTTNNEGKELLNNMSSTSFFSLHYYIQVAYSLIQTNSNLEKYYGESIYKALRSIVIAPLIPTSTLLPRIRKDYVTLILDSINYFFNDIFKSYHENRKQYIGIICKHIFLLLALLDDTDNDNRKTILYHLSFFFNKKVDFKSSISYLANFMLLFGNDYGANLDVIEKAYGFLLLIIHSNITLFNYNDYEQILILFGHILRTSNLSPEYHLVSLEYLRTILDHICNNHMNNKFVFMQEVLLHINRYTEVLDKRIERLQFLLESDLKEYDNTLLLDFLKNQSSTRNYEPTQTIYHTIRIARIPNNDQVGDEIINYRYHDYYQAVYHIYQILMIILHHCNTLSANLDETLNVRDIVIKVIKLYCRLLKCSSLYQPNFEISTWEIEKLFTVIIEGISKLSNYYFVQFLSTAIPIIVQNYIENPFFSSLIEGFLKISSLEPIFTCHMVDYLLKNMNMLEEQDPQNPPYYNLMKLLFKNSITKKTENEFIVLFPKLLLTCCYYLLHSKHCDVYIQLMLLFIERMNSIPQFLIGSTYTMCLDTILPTLLSLAVDSQHHKLKYQFLSLITSFPLPPYYETCHLESFLRVYFMLSEEPSYQEHSIQQLLRIMKECDHKQLIELLSQENYKKQLQALLYRYSNSSSHSLLDSLLQLIGSLGGSLRDELYTFSSLPFSSTTNSGIPLTLYFNSKESTQMIIEKNDSYNGEIQTEDIDPSEDMDNTIDKSYPSWMPCKHSTSMNKNDINNTSSTLSSSTTVISMNSNENGEMNSFKVGLDACLEDNIHFLANHLVSFKEKEDSSIKSSSKFIVLPTRNENEIAFSKDLIKQLKLQCWEMIRQCVLTTISPDSIDSLSILNYNDKVNNDIPNSLSMNQSQYHYLKSCYYGLFLCYLDKDIHDSCQPLLHDILSLMFILLLQQSYINQVPSLYASFNSYDIKQINDENMYSIFGMEPPAILAMFQSDTTIDMSFLIDAFIELMKDGQEDVIDLISYCCSEFISLSKQLIQDPFIAYYRLFAFFDSFLSHLIFACDNESWKLHYCSILLIHYFISNLPIQWIQHNCTLLITFLFHCLEVIPTCHDQTIEMIKECLLTISSACFGLTLSSSTIIDHLIIPSSLHSILQTYIESKVVIVNEFAKAIVEACCGTTITGHLIAMDLFSQFYQNPVLSGNEDIISITTTVISFMKQIVSSTILSELSDIELITYIKTLYCFNNMGIYLDTIDYSQLIPNLISIGMMYIPKDTLLFMDYLPENAVLPSATTHFPFSQDLHREVSEVILTFISQLLQKNQFMPYQVNDLFDYLLQIIHAGNNHLCSLCTDFKNIFNTNYQQLQVRISSIVKKFADRMQAKDSQIHSIPECIELSFIIPLLHDTTSYEGIINACSKAIEYLLHDYTVINCNDYLELYFDIFSRINSNSDILSKSIKENNVENVLFVYSQHYSLPLSRESIIKILATNPEVLRSRLELNEFVFTSELITIGIKYNFLYDHVLFEIFPIQLQNSIQFYRYFELACNLYSALPDTYISIIHSMVDTVQRDILQKQNEITRYKNKINNSYSLSSIIPYYNEFYESVDIVIRCALLLLRKQFSEQLYIKLLSFFSYPIPCCLFELYEYCHYELPQTITSEQLQSIMNLVIPFQENNIFCIIKHCIIPLYKVTKQRKDLQFQFSDQALEKILKQTEIVLSSYSFVNVQYSMLELYCILYQDYPLVKQHFIHTEVFRKVYKKSTYLNNLFIYLFTLHALSTPTLSFEEVGHIMDNVFRYAKYFFRNSFQANFFILLGRVLTDDMKRQLIKKNVHYNMKNIYYNRMCSYFLKYCIHLEGICYDSPEIREFFKFNCLSLSKDNPKKNVISRIQMNIIYSHLAKESCPNEWNSILRDYLSQSLSQSRQQIHSMIKNYIDTMETKLEMSISLSLIQNAITNTTDVAIKDKIIFDFCELLIHIVKNAFFVFNDDDYQQICYYVNYLLQKIQIDDVFAICLHLLLNLPKRVMTSIFPTIYQNLKLLECSSTQSLFRYIYIIIQLIPNLTVIPDDICKELMKVLLKMYDSVLVLNENARKGIQGQREETVEGIQEQREEIQRQYNTDDYLIPCLPPSRKEEEYCYYELLLVICQNITKFSCIKTDMITHITTALQVEGIPSLTHLLLEIIVDWTKKQEKIITDYDYELLTQSLVLVSRLPPIFENQYSLHLYLSFMDYICKETKHISRLLHDSHEKQLSSYILISSSISHFNEDTLQPLHSYCSSCSVFEILRLIFTYDWSCIERQQWLPIALYMLLQKIDMSKVISINPLLSIQKPCYGKGCSLDDERSNIDITVWQTILDSITHLYEERQNVTISSLLSSLSILSFSHRHISELLWLSVFPAAWSNCTKEQQISLLPSIESFITKDHQLIIHFYYDIFSIQSYLSQSLKYSPRSFTFALSKPQSLFSNSIQLLLESFIHCNPILILSLPVYLFVSRYYHCGYIANYTLSQYYPNLDSSNNSSIQLALFDIYNMIHEQDLAFGVYTTISSLKNCKGYFYEVFDEYLNAWHAYRHFTKERECQVKEIDWSIDRASYCLRQLKQWNILVEQGKSKEDLDLLIHSYSHLNQWNQIFELLSSHIWNSEANAYNIDYTLLFCESIIMTNHIERFQEVYHHIQSLLMNHLRSYPLRSYASRSSLYQHIQQLHNISLLLPFIHVDSYEKEDRVEAIRLMRENVPASYDSIEYWEELLDFRQAVYSKYDSLPIQFDLRSDFEKTSLLLIDAYYQKSLYSAVFETSLSLYHRNLLSPKTIVQVRDYLVKIASKYDKESYCNNSILTINPHILDNKSLSVLYNDCYMICKNNQSIENQNSMMRLLSYTINQNNKDSQAWNHYVHLLLQKKDQKDDLLLALLATIELSPSMNIEAMTQLLILLPSITNESVVQNINRIPPQYLIPFITILFSLDIEVLKHTTPVIHYLILHYPQECYYFLMYQQSLIKQESNDSILLPGKPLVKFDSQHPSFIQQSLLGFNEVLLKYHEDHFSSLKASLELFVHSLLSISHDIIRETLWAINQIDYEIGDQLVLSKETIDIEIQNKIQTLCTILNNHIVPNDQIFIQQCKNEFEEDFKPFLPDSINTQPITYHDLHNQIQKWRSRFEDWIAQTPSYSVNDCHIKGLQFIYHSLSLPNYEGQKNGKIHSIRSIRPHVYQQPYQDRIIEEIDSNNRIIHLAIQHFQLCDLMFLLSSSFLQYGLSIIWNMNDQCKKRHLTVQHHTITPINWYTALIENDPSMINLQSIAEQLLKEESCDVNEVYLTMIQNKQHYFEEKTPRNLNIACRCMIHKSFSSYLFSKFSNVMDYELWKIQFSHSLASFSFLQLLFNNSSIPSQSIFVNMSNGEITSLISPIYSLSSTSSLQYILNQSKVPFRLTNLIEEYLGDYYLRGCFQLSLDSIFIAINKKNELLFNLQTLFEKTNLRNFDCLMHSQQEIDQQEQIIIENVKMITSQYLLSTMTPSITNNTKDIPLNCHELTDKYIMKALQPENQIEMDCAWSMWL